MIELGFQLGRGPLPGLTWKKIDGRLRYEFLDAANKVCFFVELPDDHDGERMAIGVKHSGAVAFIKLDKDSAYWLSQALLTFANTGRLP